MTLKEKHRSMNMNKVKFSDLKYCLMHCFLTLAIFIIKKYTLNIDYVVLYDLFMYCFVKILFRTFRIFMPTIRYLLSIHNVSLDTRYLIWNSLSRYNSQSDILAHWSYVIACMIISKKLKQNKGYIIQIYK